MQIDKEVISPSIGCVELTRFLRLDLLFEKADIFRLRNFNSEVLSFWIVIEKQAVERECGHQDA